METNWLELWRDLVVHNPLNKNSAMFSRFADQARNKSERPDPLLDFVLAGLDKTDSVLDIGAGSGRWTIPLSQFSKHVTAIEPAPSMCEILRERISADEITNIDIISNKWESVEVPVHDISLCSQAMYDSPDFAGFVRKMERSSRKMCFLAIRLPPSDGIIGELSLTLFGRRNDTPNALIAFNALYSMGIYPDVKVEEQILNWVDANLEDACRRAKRHLRMDELSQYDSLIRDTLRRRLARKGDNLVWPDGMRSALFYWKPSTSGNRIE
jgi:SAM-dependent methyltransferase